MTTPRKGSDRPANHNMSGIHTLKKAVKRLGNRAFDRRTKGGKTFLQFRDALIADLGGIDKLGAAKLHLIDSAAVNKVLLQSIDGFLLDQKSMVNGRNRTALPVLRERQQIQDNIARTLEALGLERAPGASTQRGRAITAERLALMPQAQLDALWSGLVQALSAIYPGVDVAHVIDSADSWDRAEIAMEALAAVAASKPAPPIETAPVAEEPAAPPAIDPVPEAPAVEVAPAPVAAPVDELREIRAADPVCRDNVTWLHAEKPQ